MVNYRSHPAKGEAVNARVSALATRTRGAPDPDRPKHRRIGWLSLSPKESMNGQNSDNRLIDLTHLG